MLRHARAEDGVSRLYRLAYDKADREQAPVLVVLRPRPAYSQDLHHPYVVALDQADAWEKANGELVQPRRPV